MSREKEQKMKRKVLRSVATVIWADSTHADYVDQIAAECGVNDRKVRAYMRKLHNQLQARADRIGFR